MGIQVFNAQPIQKNKVEHILKEAGRDFDHSLHVANPSPPTFLYGTSADFDLMTAQILHDCETVKRMRKNRNGIEKPQSIKANEAVILAGIASYPKEQATAEPELFQIWQRKTIEFLQAEYGDKLRAVLLHTDENNPHLHFFVVPENLDVSTVFEPHKIRKENTTLSKRALKFQELEALRNQQGRFNEQVGAYTALARFGPGGRKLERGEWRREEEQRIANAKQFAAAAKAEKDIEEKAKGVAQREHKLAVDVSKARQKLTTLATKAKQEAKHVADTIIAKATEEAEALTAAPAKVGARISGFLQGFTKKKAIEELTEEWENRFDLTKRDYAKKYNNVLELYEQNKQSLTRANKKLQDVGISTENAPKPNFTPKPIITIDTGGPK